MTKKQSEIFQKTVTTHYKKYGRHDLPWRKTKDPYRVLVSEVMLQQTQVPRVLVKYRSFLKHFPTVRSLANASLANVLTEWQGLGYNRRARALQQAAKAIITRFEGKVPGNFNELITLPGVGPYTASALLAFAFNEPVVMIETNIRTVYLHHFFPHRERVHDAELLPLIEATLDHAHPREWYFALMDYGAYLKASGVQLNEKRVGYKKQSTFQGSDRQLRGAIVRVLAQEKNVSLKKLEERVTFSKSRIQLQLKRLAKEGMITQKAKRWQLER